jgi:dTDP-4-dehydrorhamnose 3,5-epimerase
MSELILTPIKRIRHPKGDILHALKISDNSYSGFGEAYFSIIHYNEIKGWKRHRKMTLNLIVPQGNVRFYHYDSERKKVTFIDIGAKNYMRLTVRPQQWIAFEGLDKGLNLILNIANITHDPDEADTVPLTTFPIH